MLVRPSRRFWREDFLESRWFSFAWPRISLPFLVTEKRLAAPRWLFILGTGVVSLLLLCARETFRLVISARSPVPCGGELAPPHAPQERLRHGNRSRAARQGVRAGAEGAPLLGGENTAIMLRPSCRAGLSTWAMSTMSVASRSSRRRPSSVCAISRPRNMIVTLTLWPCLRNRSTWPFFVS